MKKPSKKLEELLKMAENNPLSQKPSKALGSLASEFIEAYAKRMPGNAFNEGMRLGDETLVLAAIEQIAEQNYRGESLLAAYKHLRNSKLNSNLQYPLRRMVLESYPAETYMLDFETFQQRAADADRIDLYRLNEDLMESREYFAGLKPHKAVEEGSKQIEGSTKDPVLVALAKPYQLIQTILSGDLCEASSSYGIQALLLAKACPEILRKIDSKESEHERKERIQKISKLGYSAAQSTANSYLKEEAMKLFVQHDLTSAAEFALEYGTPELARFVVWNLIKSEDFYFSGDASFTKGNGDLAYQLAKKHNLKEDMEKIVDRIIVSAPKNALNYGLREGDKYLVREARKKLGKKVSRESIRLFQQSSGERR